MKHPPPIRGFTPSYLESLKPEEKQYDVHDPITPGLCIRVEPSGTKTFRSRLRGMKLMITIGRWSMKPRPGHVTLKEARGRHARLSDARAIGESQVATVATAFRRQDQPVRYCKESDPDSFAAIFRQFYERYLVHSWKHPEMMLRAFERDVLPAIGHLPADSVASPHIGQIIDKIVARGAPTHAAHVLAYVKQVYGWAMGVGLVTSNPSAILVAASFNAFKGVGERYLSPPEIHVYWHGLAEAGIPERSRIAGRLLLVTGARINQLCTALRSDIDLSQGLWRIDKHHQKRKKRDLPRAKDYFVPLCPLAKELFAQLLSISVRSPFVLSSPWDPNRHIDSSTLNNGLVQAFGRKSGTLKPRIALPGGPVTHHDLRRTMSTLMEDELNIEPSVVERCLNHGIVNPYSKGDLFTRRLPSGPHLAASVACRSRRA